MQWSRTKVSYKAFKSKSTELIRLLRQMTSVKKKSWTFSKLSSLLIVFAANKKWAKQTHAKVERKREDPFDVS